MARPAEHSPEITPEMIEAGIGEVSAALSSEISPVEAEEIVASIYEAMFRVSPERRLTSRLP